MLTYNMSLAKGPLYQYLAECIKTDIYNGNLMINAKMPSKRTLATNLGVSTITVENAYDQLISEGYLYTRAKRGYYVANIIEMHAYKRREHKSLNIEKRRYDDDIIIDLTSNQMEKGGFPFSVWAKLMRETISMREAQLLEASPCEGVADLREAIAEHLFSFRGMDVDPDQIIVGAGTEYLYEILIKLLGREKIYCIETPGYKKLQKIYESAGVKCEYIEMDQDGIVIDDLWYEKSAVVHLSPTHHFPTGITMPLSRRYEVLSWASKETDRYIIEDDYDSEFRVNGKPIPPFYSIDACEKVIYMNTFSKSLASTIRISYMVLPEHLANKYYESLSFFSNTVSTFEQYTLAAFIKEGYFEKHINRMRLRYGRKRLKVLEVIKAVFEKDQCEILENESGLHFLLRLNTDMPDEEIRELLMETGINIHTVSEYCMGDSKRYQHQFILNYSNIDLEVLEPALQELKKIIKIS